MSVFRFVELGCDWFHIILPMLDGFHNFSVSCAAAQCASKRLANLIFCRIGFLVNECFCGKYHGGSAEATLNCTFLYKRFLQRMEFAVLRNTFDGCDVAALGFQCYQETGVYRLVIYQNRTSAAVTHTAPNFRPSQA